MLPGAGLSFVWRVWDFLVGFQGGALCGCRFTAGLRRMLGERYPAVAGTLGRVLFLFFRGRRGSGFSLPVVFHIIYLLVAMT